MSEPWSKGRKEIRRLLAYGKQQQHREAIKLTWDYLQKDDIGNGHEYPMYLFLGGEPVWAVLAHREFLAQKHEHTPIHAMISLAAIYRYLGEFELAEKQLADAMNNLPDPPWRVMRQAEFHDGYGDLYVAWGKLDKAKHHYEQAVRIYPTAKPKYGGHLLPRKAKKVQPTTEPYRSSDAQFAGTTRHPGRLPGRFSVCLFLRLLAVCIHIRQFDVSRKRVVFGRGVSADRSVGWLVDSNRGPCSESSSCSTSFASFTAATDILTVVRSSDLLNAANRRTETIAIRAPRSIGVDVAERFYLRAERHNVAPS